MKRRHWDLGVTWTRMQEPARSVRRLAEVWRIRMTVRDLRNEDTGIPCLNSAPILF